MALGWRYLRGSYLMVAAPGAVEPPPQYVGYLVALVVCVLAIILFLSLLVRLRVKRSSGDGIVPSLDPIVVEKERDIVAVRNWPDEPRNRVIIWSKYNTDGKPVVTVPGARQTILCTSQTGAEQVARAIGRACELAGGTAQVRRKDSKGKFLPEWTYGADPSDRPG